MIFPRSRVCLFRYFNGLREIYDTRAPFVVDWRELMRLATASRIRSIDFAKSGIAGTGSLTPRARRMLAVYVALVKMDYSGVDAPMGAIADAMYRSSHGEAKSIRTAERANDELESHGYISAEHRSHPWRYKGAHIIFNIDAFAYWTQKPVKNVQPLPISNSEKMCSDVTQPTTCRPSERTKTDPRVNTPQIIPSKNKEPRAGARSNNNNKQKRRNAVWTSVTIVLGKMRLYRRDRKSARELAKCEIAAMKAGVEIVHPSGVDWSYWTKRFADMPIDARESTAKREIVPLLLGWGNRNANPIAPPPNRVNLESTVIPPEDIRAVREQLEAAFSFPKSQKTETPTQTETPGNTPCDSMDDDELRVLLAARDRARSRVNCG